MRAIPSHEIFSVGFPWESHSHEQACLFGINFQRDLAKRSISTSLVPLITQCNQLTMGLGKFAPKSRTGKIYCPKLKFQKVIISKAHAIFLDSYQ